MALRRLVFVCLGVLTGLWGCSGVKESAPVIGPTSISEPLTYKQDIRPILQQNCVSCHSGGSAAGHYDLSTIAGIMGTGSDNVPDAIPGNAASLLVTITQAGGSHADRIGSVANAEALRKWVVEDSMGMTQPAVHPEGWMVVGSPNFHGKAVADKGYDMSSCRSCHGADYSGGIAKSSCLDCHVNTPEDCSTCHGSAVNPAPPLDLSGDFDTTFPGVGAHQAHLTEGPVAGAFPCQTCHVVPQALHDPGHVDSPPPAKVQFSGLADSSGAAPVWNGTTCTNTYCHGNATPKWTSVGTGEAACGTCHGLPPSLPHPQVQQCDLCHGTVVNADRQIINKSLHINGKVDISYQHPAGFADPNSPNFHKYAIQKLGWDLSTCQGCHGTDYAGGFVGVSCLTCHVNTPEDCSTCHGSKANPAPPLDLYGHTATTFVGVGAHQAHLTDGPWTRAITCDECHVVPQKYSDPGHIAGLPAKVTFGTLATTGGVKPVWDGSTCANTYCHGDFKGGNNKTMVWTWVGGSQTACGSCHGLPPGPDSGHPQVQQCSLCHGQVVDDNMNIINKSLHMDGKVEVGN